MIVTCEDGAKLMVDSKVMVAAVVTFAVASVFVVGGVKLPVSIECITVGLLHSVLLSRIIICYNH